MFVNFIPSDFYNCDFFKCNIFTKPQLYKNAFKSSNLNIFYDLSRELDCRNSSIQCFKIAIVLK